MRTVVHQLKTDPEVFAASWEGIKGFEIRFNDRDFEPGDELLLKETRFSGEEMKEGAPLEFTGREIDAHVNYMLRGGNYGLAEGWVILSVDFFGFREPNSSN